MTPLTQWAQQEKIEELQEKLHTPIHDTVRFNLLVDLGYAWNEVAPESAYVNADKALMLIEPGDRVRQREALQVKMMAYYYQNRLDECMATLRAMNALLPEGEFKKRGAAYNNMGLMHLSLNRYDSALYYYQKALDEYARMNDKFNKGISDVYSNMALVHYDLGNPERAMELNMRALDFLDITATPTDLASVYNNIGSLFLKMGDRQEAIQYLSKSLELKEKHRMLSSIANTYVLLGNALQQEQKFAEAESHYHKALEAERQMGNKSFEASTLTSIAGLYLEQKRPHDALTKARLSLQLKKEYSSEGDVASGYLMLGKIHRTMNDVDSARHYFLLAEKTFGTLGLKMDRLESLNELTQLQKNAGHIAEALQYSEQAYALRDSILNEDKQRTIRNLEVIYRTERQREEIEQLSVKHELQQLKLNRQRAYLVASGAAAVVLTLIVLLMGRNFRQRKLIMERERENRDRQQQLVALRSMMTGEEKERSRIAKDLHDGLSSLLAVSRMKIEKLRNSGIELDETISDAAKSIDEASTEVRRIAHNMLPEMLMKFGLVESLNEYLRNLHNGKLKMDFQHYGLDQRLPETMELMIYRIVQELVNNAVKHAAASEVLVQLQRNNGTLLLTVEDNGCGFDQSKTSMGAGIQNIESRVEYLKGNLHIESHEGRGTSVYIEMPVTEMGLS